MDNVTAPAAGAQFATDEIAGVHYPRSKLAFGSDGQATDVSPANPLPVNLDAVVAALADVATGADIGALITAMQSSGGLTDAQLRAAAIAVTVAALPLPSGAATSAKQDAIIAALGQVLQVSGPLTDTQLRAAAIAVTVATLPLPTGAATSAKQDAIIAAIGQTLQVAGPLTDVQLRAVPVPISAAGLPLPAGAATSAAQATNTAAIEGLKSPHYKTVAAGQTDIALGAAPAIGDLLASLTIIPTSTSPGAVTIKDGAGAAITVFPGGANSVSTLHPFSVPLGVLATAAGWKVSAGANVSVIAAGRFS